jgi:hypothetical protein
VFALPAQLLALSTHTVIAVEQHLRHFAQGIVHAASFRRETSQASVISAFPAYQLSDIAACGVSE